MFRTRGFIFRKTFVGAGVVQYYRITVRAADIIKIKILV